MGFWRGMSQGFEQGVPLGVRAADRAEEKRRWEIENAREEAREGRQKTSHEQRTQLGKKQLESADLELQAKQDQARQKNFRRSVVVAKALAENGDDEAAGALISQAYNKMVNNGDEVRLIFKKHKPDDKMWKDPKAKDANILVLSKNNGLRPVKSVNDLIRAVEPYADPDRFFAYEQQERAKVDDLNAQEKPFRGKDNRLYVRKWSLTASNGKQAEIVPYTGQEPMSQEEQKVRVVKGLVEDGVITKEQGNVALGFSTAEAPSERIAAEKLKRQRQLEALDKLGGLKGEEYYDALKKKLGLLLTPFVGDGKQTIDTESYEMTTEGKNGLKEAEKLLSKDATTLTDSEKRLLPHAQKAWAVYEQISEAVAPTKPVSKGGGKVPVGQMTQAQIDEAAKNMGFVKDANGKWAEPKTATDKGKRKGLDTSTAQGSKWPLLMK